jgi:catechol 2,3-dioxygenase-like lactoylglutathione lyase family enzyme
MTITATNHTSFTVRDVGRSISFYRDVVGLELITTIRRREGWIAEMTRVPDADLCLAVLRVPGDSHVLELIQYVGATMSGDDAPPLNRPATAHLGFVVSDIDAEYRRLRDLGVDFLSPPVTVTEPPSVGARAVYLRDPDGIVLELQQRVD